MACPRCGCKVHYQCDDEDAPDDQWQRCASCGVGFHIEDSADEEGDEDEEVDPKVRAALQLLSDDVEAYKAKKEPEC